MSSLFTEPIRANKVIWIIGDVYLTDAAAVLSQIQTVNKDELYLYQAYDIRMYFPKKQCTDTFGKCVRNTLYEALRENNRLPAVLLVITGNQKIDDMVSTPYHTKRIWTAVCTEIDRAIKARKNDLPRKAFLNDEPRVFFSNIYPRYKDHCETHDQGFESFKTKRRRLNNIMPQVMSNYNFEVLPISGIIPDNQEYFILSTGQLSGKGMDAFWRSVSKELKLADELVKEKIKNKIIKSYLEEKHDQEHIRNEQQNIRHERLTLDKNIPTRQFDRGDFGRYYKGRKHFNKRRGNSANR